MKIVIPKIPTDFTSTIPMPDTGEGAEWSADTTYAAHEPVFYNKEVYTSLSDANKGNIPDKTTSGIEAKWRPRGSTNKWACFDVVNSTQSVGPSGAPLIMEIPVNYVDTIAMLHVKGAWVRVELFDGDAAAPYYDSGHYSLIEDVTNEWDYEFLPISYKKDVYFMDLPVCIVGRLRVTINNGSTVAAIGTLVAGISRKVGPTLYGVSATSKSFSKVIEDEFGNALFVKRRTAKRINGEMYASQTEVDAVKNLLDDIDATPVLCIGDNRASDKGGLQMLTVFGYVRDYDIGVPSYNSTTITVQFEGIA